MPVICEGCGQRVPLPEGYRRNKIQCPCGVICPVPEAARQEASVPAPARPHKAAKPSPSVEEEAERWLLEDTSSAPQPDKPPPIFHDPEPAAEAARKPAVAEMRFPCRRCRRLVRRQGECPDCDGFVPSQAEAENEERVWWPSVDQPEDKDDEEDSSPYEFVDADDVKCPECCLLLPPGSVLCVRCGFHLQKLKKVNRTYQPMERVWETNGSYQVRLNLFLTCEAFFGILGLSGVVSGKAGLGMFFFSFLTLSAMLAFLLGTFDRIHLTRDARGRVQLIKTWRVCFFALTPQSIDVRSFEGISSGQHRPVSPWDSWLIYFLLPFGIIPALIWWYLVFYKITYHVALNRDHGYPAYQVYSGWNANKMKEIAYALRDASGLPYDEG